MGIIAEATRAVEWYQGRKTVEAPTEDRAETYSWSQVPPFLANPNTAVVGETQALSVPAFWRGVRLKSETISTLPLHAYRGDERIDTPSLLERPDPREDRVVTLSRLLTSLILRGNAFALLGGFDEFGYPTSIAVVHPDQVSYDIDRTLYTVAGELYDPSQIMHIRGLTLAGEFFGSGVIEYHRRTLDHSIKVDEFSRNYFADNATPGGILKVDRADVSTDEIEGLITKWMARQGGRRTPVGLPKDITFEPISISNEDSQFLQTKVQNLTDVANIVGVPGYFIGAPGSSMTYSNLEMESLNLLKFYLRADMIAVERAFSELMPADVEAKFNADALLRTDTKGRYEAHAVGLENGFLTVDEVRALEDKPSLGKEPEAVNNQKWYAALNWIKAGANAEDVAAAFGIPVIKFDKSPVEEAPTE